MLVTIISLLDQEDVYTRSEMFTALLLVSLLSFFIFRVFLTPKLNRHHYTINSLYLSCIFLLSPILEEHISKHKNKQEALDSFMSSKIGVTELLAIITLSIHYLKYEKNVSFREAEKIIENNKAYKKESTRLIKTLLEEAIESMK